MSALHCRQNNGSLPGSQIFIFNLRSTKPCGPSFLRFSGIIVMFDKFLDHSEISLIFQFKMLILTLGTHCNSTL